MHEKKYNAEVPEPDAGVLNQDGLIAFAKFEISQKQVRLEWASIVKELLSLSRRGQ